MNDQDPGVHLVDTVPPLPASAVEVIDIDQIIYAMERAERALQAQAEALWNQLDYSAEFPAEDAERMREGIALLRQLQCRPAVTLPVVDAMPAQRKLVASCDQPGGAL